MIGHSLEKLDRLVEFLSSRVFSEIVFIAHQGELTKTVRKRSALFNLRVLPNQDLVVSHVWGRYQQAETRRDPAGLVQPDSAQELIWVHRRGAAADQIFC